jgi:hypothetical protein
MKMNAGSMNSAIPPLMAKYAVRGSKRPMTRKIRLGIRVRNGRRMIDAGDRRRRLAPRR